MATLFQGESLEAIWRTGAIPCLTWEPMYYSAGHEFMIPCQAILNGAYDPYLLKFAKQAASWKRPFMIRLAHEMNIRAVSLGNEEVRIWTPKPLYLSAHVQICGGHVSKGRCAEMYYGSSAPNSESVPNTSYDPRACWNRIEDYYPGDTYVDVLGIDGYNWGTTQTKAKNGWDSQWKEFAAIFHPAWETLRQLAPHKPIIVFETASVSQGGDKGLWIKNAFETAKAWKMNGIVWFQVKKEYDWRINSGGDTFYRDVLKANACSPHQWIRGLQHDQGRTD